MDYKNRITNVNDNNMRNNNFQVAQDFYISFFNSNKRKNKYKKF